MKENEEITNLERFELLIEDGKEHRELYGEFSVGEYDIEIMQHILSDYKRVLKENEELKENLKEENELNKIIKYTKLDELFCRRNGKKVEQAIKLRDELLKLPECKLYGIKKCKKSVILITKEEVIPVQEVKDKIEELKNNIDYLKQFKDWNEKDYTNEDIINNILEVLDELIERRK